MFWIAPARVASRWYPVAIARGRFVFVAYFTAPSVSPLTMNR
jgi:hypothetical protein